MSECGGILKRNAESLPYFPPYASAFCRYTCDDITPEKVNRIIAMTEDLFT